MELLSNHWLILHIAIAVGTIITFVLPSVSATVSEDSQVFVESPTVEKYVEDYWSDTPIMADVAWCESRFRQFGKDGDIFRGEINNQDVGVMQINEHYHLDTANKLGINLYTLEGNLEYARYLYDKQGTQPWSSSEKCWSNKHLVKR